MADEYVILLRNETTDNNKETPVAGDNSTDDGGVSASQQISSELDDGGVTNSPTVQNSFGRRATFRTIAAVKMAENLVFEQISFENNQVEIKTGAKEYQQKQKFAIDLTKRGIDSVASIGAGAILAGGMGAATAAVATVVALAMTGIRYLQNAETIQNKQNLENVSITLSNIRMGAANSRGNRQ